MAYQEPEAPQCEHQKHNMATQWCTTAENDAKEDVESSGFGFEMPGFGHHWYVRNTSRSLQYK